MSTGNVARRLIELCRAGQFDRALEELYAQDARSIEMDGMDGGPLGNVDGLDAIKQLRDTLGGVAIQRGIDAEHQDIGGGETDIHRAQILERAHEQAGADQQHHRQCHLRDEQAARQPAA